MAVKQSCSVETRALQAKARKRQAHKVWEGYMFPCLRGGARQHIIKEVGDAARLVQAQLAGRAVVQGLWPACMAHVHKRGYRACPVQLSMAGPSEHEGPRRAEYRQQ